MKYHVSKSGNPARCTATVKPCPLGENTPHFETIQETVKYIEENAQTENEIFNSMKKKEGEFSVDENLKRVESLEIEFEKKNEKNFVNIPDDEIVDGKFTGKREIVDAIEKQIIQAKAAGENIEYMRSKKGLSHTINFSGDYKPLKKLADTVDYYNQNYVPLHHVYNIDKKDYDTIKDLMGEISPDYKMPRKPLRGSTFEIPITLTLKDHKALTRKLVKLGVNF